MFVVFDTVAVSAVVVPSRTEVVAAVTLTLIGAEVAGVPEEFEPVMPPHPIAETAWSITTKEPRVRIAIAYAREHSVRQAHEQMKQDACQQTISEAQATALGRKRTAKV